MNTSVLVGFTPTHLIPMLEVARDLPGKVWFFHPEAGRIPVEMRGGLSFIGGCEHANRPRALKYLSAGVALRGILGKDGGATVCVPHPFNPLSNFAFFAPAATDLRIYQDGILNYYDAANPFVAASALLRRRLRAAAALLPFRPYSGHLSGIEARDVSVGYFTHPAQAVLPGRFASMKRLAFDASMLPREQRSPGNPITLFLDQPIERSMPAEAARSCRELACEVADSFGHTVIWKPHYTQRTSFVPRRGWRPASSEEAAMPAEEIPAVRRVETVVSFHSSALANLRMLRPELRCVAVGAAAIPVRVNGRQRTMADLLGEFGVDTIEARAVSGRPVSRGGAA